MSKTCWSCLGKVLKTDFFCPKCRNIQENVIIEVFDIFGIEKSIIINEDELEESYLKLQKIFHPDKFLNLTDKEKKISNVYSSKINELYKSLKNNTKRIDLILEKEGHKIKEIQDTYKNSEILEEIMDIQEEFMLAGDNNKNLVKKKIKKLIHNILIDTEKLYKNKSYDLVSKNNIKLSYLEKILKS